MKPFFLGSQSISDGKSLPVSQLKRLMNDAFPRQLGNSIRLCFRQLSGSLGSHRQ